MFLRVTARQLVNKNHVKEVAIRFCLVASRPGQEIVIRLIGGDEVVVGAYLTEEETKVAFERICKKLLTEDLLDAKI